MQPRPMEGEENLALPGHAPTILRRPIGDQPLPKVWTGHSSSDLARASLSAETPPNRSKARTRETQRRVSVT